MFAAKPSYTCCSSSPKISHRFARCDFRGPRLFQRTHIIKCRRFTPSVSRGIGKLGAKAKSVVFAFASDFAHKICFKLLKQIFVIFRKTPLSSPCSVQPEFSSAARPFRAHLFILSLSSRKGAAESRDFQGCRPRLASFKGFYLLFICKPSPAYLVRLFVKSRAAFTFPAKAKVFANWVAFPKL